MTDEELQEFAIDIASNAFREGCKTALVGAEEYFKGIKLEGHKSMPLDDIISELNHLTTLAGSLKPLDKENYVHPQTSTMIN